MRRLWLYLLLIGAALATPFTASAQAVPTANGPGERLTIGVTASAFQADYGQRVLGGFAVFADANLTSRYGVEAEYRKLNFHTNAGVTETTYLAGPRARFYVKKLRPYAKFLGGIGHFTYPYGYATGNYAVIAPAAGVDLRINDAISVRVVDAQYQVWPGFSFGTLRPYGISTGISFRIF